MIKFNRILRLASFSNIKFPEQYVQAFNISTQIKSCLSLSELHKYVVNNEERIRQYGKTIILEYLNQIPLHFAHMSQNSPQLYFYLLSLKDLNLYERQLLIANLSKIGIYMGPDSHRMKDLIYQEISKLQQAIQVQQFDIVDALNWLAMRKIIIGTLKITQHAFKRLEEIPMDQHLKQITKLMNMILRKIEDIEWMQVRQFKKIFGYMCHIYIEPRDSIMVYLTNCYRLSKLELQLLGYDSYPKTIYSLFLNIQTILPEVSIRSVEMLYNILNFLPYHAVHKDVYKLLHKYFIEATDNQIHIQMLPLNKMTKQQLDSTLYLYGERHTKLSNAVYNFNYEEMKIVFIHGGIVHHYFNNFMKPVKDSELVVQFFSMWIVTFRRIYTFYRYDKKKADVLAKRFKQVYQQYVKKFGAYKTLSSVSATNIFHLRSIDLVINFAQDKKQFIRITTDALNNFCKKKMQSSLLTKKFKVQLEQIVGFYKNSNQPEIVKLLNGFIIQNFHQTYQLSLKHLSWMLFSLEDSQNSLHFKEITQKLRSKFKSNFPALVDYYMFYPYKNTNLTLLFMKKIWTRSQSFESIGRLIAHTDVLQFQSNHKDNIPSIHLIKTLNAAEQILTKQDLTQLSLGQLTCILKIIRWYLSKFQSFALKFVQILVSDLNERYDKLAQYRSEELQASFFWELKQLCKEIQLKEQTKSKIKDFQQKFNNLLIYSIKDSDDFVRILNSSNFNLLKAFRLSLLESTKNRNLLKVIKSRLTRQTIDEYYMTPQNIKKHIEDVYNFQEKTKDNFSSLQQLLLYCLDSVKVQQGPEYYMWTLKIAQRYRLTRLIRPTLRQLCVHILSERYLVKLLDILIEFPEEKCDQFSEHLFQLLKFELPIRNNNYLSALYYLTISYNELPKQSQQVAEDMIFMYSKKILKSIQTISNNKEDINLLETTLKQLLYYFVIYDRNPWLKKMQNHLSFVQMFLKQKDVVKYLCIDNTIKGLGKSSDEINSKIDALTDSLNREII